MDGKCSIFFAVELGALVTVPVIMFIFRREKGTVTVDVSSCHEVGGATRPRQARVWLCLVLLLGSGAVERLF